MLVPGAPSRRRKLDSNARAPRVLVLLLHRRNHQTGLPTFHELPPTRFLLHLRQTPRGSRAVTGPHPQKWFPHATGRTSPRPSPATGHVPRPSTVIATIGMAETPPGHRCGRSTTITNIIGHHGLSPLKGHTVKVHHQCGGPKLGDQGLRVQEGEDKKYCRNFVIWLHDCKYTFIYCYQFSLFIVSSALHEVTIGFKGVTGHCSLPYNIYLATFKHVKTVDVVLCYFF